jgi:hypothetical protein
VKDISFIAAAAAFAPIVDREHASAADLSEDNPRISKLSELGRLIAECLAEAPAQSFADVASKCVVLKIELPDGRSPEELWGGACQQEKLAWSVAQDAIRLAEQEPSARSELEAQAA